METYEVLNRLGEKTGRIQEKGEFIKEGYYLGAHGYIVNDREEFLIQKRSSNKCFLPSTWEIHMGHVMTGETSHETIVREIEEEIGIKVENIHFVKRLFNDMAEHFIDVFLIRENVDLETVLLAQDEVADVKWVTKNEMMAMIKRMDYRPENYKKCVLDMIKRLSIED